MTTSKGHDFPVSMRARVTMLLNVTVCTVHAKFIFEPFKAQWLLYVPPDLTFKNCAFFYLQ